MEPVQLFTVLGNTIYKFTTSCFSFQNFSDCRSLVIFSLYHFSGSYAYNYVCLQFTENVHYVE